MDTDVGHCGNGAAWCSQAGIPVRNLWMLLVYAAGLAELLGRFDVYQLYAYLHSQTGRGDDLADGAEGILLHPAIDAHVDEAMTIQGHRMRFVTVDLSTAADDIRRALLRIVKD